MAPLARLLARPPLVRFARPVAALIALVGITGLAIRFAVSRDQAGSAAAALWTMLRFYTIIGNALAVAMFAGIALGSRRAAAPALAGCVTINLLLIGIVYALLLRGLQTLTGAAIVADRLLHDAMPVLAGLFWLLAVPRGGLRPAHALAWAALPLAYFAYAIARAALDGRYPYPFINVATLGWPQVLLNALGIAAGFLAAGVALVWLDRRLARPGS